jgi:hypothetical protein
MIEELQVKADAPIAVITIPNRDYKKPNLWQRIMFKKPIKERTFTLYRVRTCNIDRAAIIAEKLPELNGDINSLEQLVELSMPLVKNHIKDYCYLIACFIHNKSTEPPKKLVKYLYNNLTNEELFEYVRLCLTTSGLMSFMSATLLLKGTSVRIAGEAKAKDVQSVTTQA